MFGIWKPKRWRTGESVMSKISEFFGLNCKDESLDFEAAMNTQICPYTQRVCTKMRKSDPDIKIGTCSVQYQHQDVIICPYRLLEHNQIFIDCLHLCNKFILPIMPQYHTTLLPDSQLNSENRIDFLGREPHRYALQKVYISWASTNGAKPGDLILFYRMGLPGENKKYKSVVSTIAIVDEIIENIGSEENLLSLCQNRSVFSVDELKEFWRKHRYNLKILKFIFVKSLSKRLTLGYLWEHNIIAAPGGPRPFTPITDEQFDMIVKDSETEITYVE